MRWALRDAVTVLVSQDIQEVRFNASANRVIHYGPMPEELKEAQRQITQTAVEGLRAPERTDSPVREGSDHITVPRRTYESLTAEIASLRAQQGEDLIDAALSLGGEAHTRTIELLRGPWTATAGQAH